MNTSDIYIFLFSIILLIRIQKLKYNMVLGSTKCSGNDNMMFVWFFIHSQEIYYIYVQEMFLCISSTGIVWHFVQNQSVQV